MRIVLIGLAVLGLVMGGLHFKQRNELWALRARLLECREKPSRALTVYFENMKNQFTPGFKCLRGDASSVRWTQGELFATHTSTQLAIQGEGCFGVVRDGVLRYTRDGRFQLAKDGALGNSDGWRVQGYRLDQPSSAPVDVVFESWHEQLECDGDGKVYQLLTDPVTGQIWRAPKPRYQIALYNVIHASRAESATLLKTDQPVACGRPGQGPLGNVLMSHLELANVDFSGQGQEITLAKQAYASLDTVYAEGDLRQELLEAVKRDPVLKAACLENLMKADVPGYRCWDILGYLSGRGLQRRTEAGSRLDTGDPNDLALDGEGSFLLDNGEMRRSLSFVRDGRGLRCGGAYLADKSGKRLSIPSDAGGIEIKPNGEVSYLRVSGDGKREVAGSLPVSGGQVRRGTLELANVSEYEQKIVGSALMKLAGLPTFTSSASPPVLPNKPLVLGNQR